ncbi:MAG: hypothetical protein ACR2GO_09905 [Candidatus Limnocylindria bacterium]
MVDWWYWVLLIFIAIVGLAFRLRLRHPLADWVSLDRGEAIYGGLGIGALVVHCVVMFFPTFVPGAGPLPSVAEAIRELGPISQVAYWLPAVLVILALRRLPWPVLAMLVASFLGVGVTMFWTVPLAVHLAFIATAVAILAGVLTMTVSPPWTGRRVAEIDRSHR